MIERLEQHKLTRLEKRCIHEAYTNDIQSPRIFVFTIKTLEHEAPQVEILNRIRTHLMANSLTCNTNTV